MALTEGYGLDSRRTTITGLFQIDPAIYDAETQVFAVPIVGQTLKAIVKAIQEKIGKQVAEKVQKEVAQQVGKEVSESARKRLLKK